MAKVLRLVPRPGFSRLDRYDLDFAVSQAVTVLEQGSLAILPTDTVYGLVARAFDEQAVARVFEAKGRPPERKLPLLLGEPSDVERYGTDVPEYARQLVAEHFPGALTVVVWAAPGLPAWLVDERGTVALRCPDDDLVRSVSWRMDEPLAATSVNLSGRPPATEAGGVPEEILASVALMVDRGPTSGTPSTIVDCTGPQPVPVRDGPVAPTP
jgi:L-threonylcarbamoyladenylate synthase